MTKDWEGTRAFRHGLALALALVLAPLAARAQGGAPPPDAATLMQAHAPHLKGVAGATLDVPVALSIEPGWHVNANPPAEPEMIPTTIAIAAAPGFHAGATRYPAGTRRKLAFADEELLVYDGDVTAHVPLVLDAGATPGSHTLHGTLRYQACNDQLCLAPVAVPFEVVVEVAKGSGAATTTNPTKTPPSPETASTEPSHPASAESSHAEVSPSPSAAETTDASAGGFATAPPPGAATVPISPAAQALADNPVARMFAHGSFLAFLGLFLIGLALNLTPCVYPMLGITVSIFGSRSSDTPIRTFALACFYVLGMATMYSGLGVAAALTGSLFGSWLANPWVLFGFGVMMIVLALSMFGVYELNPPYWLTSRLGGSGATNVVGVFLSGLAVGVIAAPCTGPPVVALLALVGAKGDPVFGFLAFFTLALGLGAPYLVLGTFSNLLQRLPRSGMWMVWVKKLFGSVMLALAAYFITLAFRPAWMLVVIGVVTVLAGVHLGFLEGSVPSVVFRRVQRLVGAVTIIAGIAVLWTLPRPGQTRTMTFEPYSASAFASAASAHAPVMLDFSADWCLPCHELERTTFTDAQVIAGVRGFRRFHVDLTRYDSDESRTLKSRFDVRGVPTIVFLAPDGREARAARVEGFLPPERFLERVALARSSPTASR